jgi:hypothetical protein
MVCAAMDHGAKESEQDQDARKAVEGEEKTERLDEQGEQEFERSTESNGSRARCHLEPC